MIDSLAQALDTAGIAGWVWIATCACSAILSIASLSITGRARTGGPGLAVASSSVVIGGLAAAWAATVSLGSWARRAALDRADAGDPVSGSLANVDLALVTIGPVALFALTIAAFGAVALAWSRVTRPPAAAWAVGASLAATLSVGLIEVLGWAVDARAAIDELVRSYYYTGEGFTRSMVSARERWLDGHGAIFATAGVAGIGGAAAAIVAKRRGTRTGWVPLVAAALVFAAGVAAFSATRGHAADARLILPRDALRFVDFDLVLAAETVTCNATRPIGPVFVVTPEGTRLDDRRVTIEQARQDLETMRRNWSVLHPERADVPPPVLVATPAGTPLGSLGQHLDAATSAGYRELVVIAKRERTIRTATRGSLDAHQPCFVHVGLGGEDAVPTRDIATVGELVTRAEREPGLAIAPPPPRPGIPSR